MAGLKVFFDGLSQPSRAVLLLLHANGIPFEPCVIQLSKGEQKTSEELARVNPNREVPTIDDNGFCLPESSAILKYLCRKYKLPDHWYPSEIKHQAKVDEYLGWHPSNLRRGATGTLVNKVFYPTMTGKDPDSKKVEESMVTLEKSKKLLEEYFLKEGKFIGGLDEISIADLQALCELTEFWLASHDPFEGRPRLAKWMEDCKAELQPHFDEVHKAVYALRDKGTFKGRMDV